MPPEDEYANPPPGKYGTKRVTTTTRKRGSEMPPEDEYANPPPGKYGTKEEWVPVPKKPSKFKAALKAAGKKGGDYLERGAKTARARVKAKGASLLQGARDNANHRSEVRSIQRQAKRDYEVEQARTYRPKPKAPSRSGVSGRQPDYQSAPFFQAKRKGPVKGKKNGGGIGLNDFNLGGFNYGGKK